MVHPYIKMHGLDNFKITEHNSLWQSDSSLAGKELCAFILSGSRLTTCLRFPVMWRRAVWYQTWHHRRILCVMFVLTTVHCWTIFWATWIIARLQTVFAHLPAITTVLPTPHSCVTVQFAVEMRCKVTLEQCGYLPGWPLQSLPQ
jgi:hypothetical protein